MKHNPDLERLLTHYLLGKLSEGEMRSIEDAYFADDDLYEQLQASERDLIDKYVQGELGESDRERFEKQFLLSPGRQEKLRFSRALNELMARQKEAAKSETQESMPRIAIWAKAGLKPSFVTAASVAFFLVLGLGVWLTFFRDSELTQGTSALKKAFQDQRPLQARISELHYAPFGKRGNEDNETDNDQLALAERILLDQVVNNPNSASHHAIGRFYLASREFDKAIRHLQEALKTDQRNAQLLSDLGAAYLERAVAQTDKPNLGDFATSLEHLKRAIELDDSLLAAYFNKALCLQRMNASASAIEAWEDYLKRDGNSEWSKEAERNLQLLQGVGINNRTPEEVLGDFLAAYRQSDRANAWRIQSQSKEMITKTMIPFQLAQKSLDANLSKQTEAEEEFLGAFRFAGELEREHSGELFFAELAEFYSVAGKNNAITLKQAQEALHKGYQLCLQARYNDARQHFEMAQRHFLRAGNVWEAKVVDYWQAYCLYYVGDLKKSGALLSTLAKDCQRRNYRWLESQSYCWLSTVSTIRGEYSLGVEQSKKALSIAAAIDDSYAVQKISCKVADDYKFFGRPREALDFNQQSLPSADSYFVSRRQFWRNLYSITDTLFALRLYSAAEAYQQEALKLALNDFNDSALTHSTYRRLGQIYAGQENYPAAAQAFELSLNALRPLEGDPICKRLSAMSLLQLGNVKRQVEDYPAAIRYYQQAAQAFDSSEFTVHSYNTRKAMLSCYLLSKDDRAIEKELPAVLTLFEQNRQRIKEEHNRNSFFDAEQGIYELAINYEHERNNKEQSFYYSELSRARSLQEAIIRGRAIDNGSAKTDSASLPISQPLTSTQLQERLPADLKLVEYAVLKNRLLIWIVTKTDFEVIQQPVSLAALESLTNEYLRVLPRSNADSIEREKQLAAELYDLLFAPVEEYLKNGDEVAIIPDKVLFKVPYIALLSRRSDLRVVENYRLLYAPSAAVLALCSDLARSKAQDRTLERVLSVGNPVFDRQQHQGLPDLPAAAVEARDVAYLYQDRAILIGPNALRERIMPELARADVIHFATHYLVDDFSPAKSRLLLTALKNKKIDGTADDLSLQEIQSLRPVKAKVAILSACQSGIENYFAGEGMIGLSRAFLAVGVPLIIASQWPVESDSTAELMIRFHKLRKLKNELTTEALRQAQLAMLKNEDERYRRPYYWAAFFPIGGYAQF